MSTPTREQIPVEGEPEDELAFLSSPVYEINSAEWDLMMVGRSIVEELNDDGSAAHAAVFSRTFRRLFLKGWAARTPGADRVLDALWNKE